MCGRYSLLQTEGLENRFNAEGEITGLVKPDYNIAPGHVMPVIARDQGNKIKMMRWGLVPVWAKDPKIGFKLFNARAETVEEKPAFRSSFKSKRVLVPVDSFYEWKKEGKHKEPYQYSLKDEDIFAFAGLSADWHDPNGNELQTFTIITTDANSLVRQVHDRMPVILNMKDESTWLDPETPIEQLKSLLKPFNSEKMKVKQATQLAS